MRVAVIGAGLAGLTLAHQLKAASEVVIFEKSRGVGGRLATRRREPYSFDHGAQFFKIDTTEFRDFAQPLIADGVIKRWDARFVEFEGSTITSQRTWNDNPPHYVGAPTMNAMGKYLAEPLDVKTNTRVTSIRPGRRWEIVADTGSSMGHFDWVVCTAPVMQTSALMPASYCYHDHLSSISMKACCALMLGFDSPIDLGFDAALVRNADISWISVNTSKPNRSGPTSIVVHSTNAWADEHLDDEDIITHLCAEFSRVTGVDTQHVLHKDVQRWRYANVEKQTHDLNLIDAQAQLAACGDWCIQGRVEAAFTSGMQTAQAMLAHFKAQA